MPKPMTTITVASAFGLFLALYSSAAPAQNLRSYVSRFGNDSNNCQETAPCRGFLTALANTSNGGIINCLDSGDFSGPGNVTKSITIDCIGHNAEASGGGFIISGSALVVILRGINIYGNYGNAFGNGAGVTFLNGNALYIENCRISAWGNTATPGVGINFTPAGTSRLYVTDSIISENGLSSGVSGGIIVKPAASGSAWVTLDRVTVNQNTFGIIADGTGGGSIRGAVRDSVVTGNLNNGITVTSSAGGSAVLSVESTTVGGNNYGLVAGGASSGMLVSQSSIVLNNTGLFTVSGGALLSYKNNNVNGNATADGAFTGVIGQQ